jgi:hypothetical protein
MNHGQMGRKTKPPRSRWVTGADQLKLAANQTERSQGRVSTPSENSGRCVTIRPEKKEGLFNGEVFFSLTHTLMGAPFFFPVLVHSRFSQKRCLQMLQDARIAKAVFHWYSGPLDMLDQILHAGYYVSATPALAYSPPHQAALDRRLWIASWRKPTRPWNIRAKYPNRSTF